MLEDFRSCHALLEGHFQLSSGLHSDRYFQCALLFDDPLLGRRLVCQLADKVREQGLQADRVVGAALGAMLVAHELGAALGIRACFTERQDGRMALRRGFHIGVGERILVAEDVVTTGGSAAEVAAVVREAGGVVVGSAALVDRSGGQSQLRPLVSLLTVQVQTWQPQACPLCEQGVPVTKPGSRPAVLASDAPGA